MKRYTLILLFLLGGCADPGPPSECLKQENSIEIKSVEDFLTISQSPDKNYCLGNNLDFTGVNYTPIVDFSGSFDGQGHIISGIKINSSSSNLGLFANTSGREVVIKNLLLSNFYLSGGDNVASLVSNSIAETLLI